MSKTTVLTELRAEFAITINKLRTAIATFLKAYPKVSFASMTGFMIGSCILCFTILRSPEVKNVNEEQLGKRLNDGLSEINTSTLRLQQVLKIQVAIKGVLSKDSLTTADSLLLKTLLLEMEKYRTPNHQ